MASKTEGRTEKVVTKKDPFAHTGPYPNTSRRVAVVAMYEAGLSLRQIAARIGVSFQAVHGMLRRAGVAVRDRGGNTGSHSRHRK